MYEWLARRAHMNRDFVKNMFKAKSDVSGRTTIDILTGDYKQFRLGNAEVGISQLETANPDSILQRTDLKVAMSRVGRRMKVDYYFLNVVDVLKKKSFLATFDQRTRKLLEGILGSGFSQGLSEFNRILLRKTDLVPLLQKALNE
jgi:inorganic pyrophosphatase/exopolyphosphatase